LIMNILLLTSYLGDNEPLVFPIGLSCIKSSLNNHNVKVYDVNLSKMPFEEIKEIIAIFVPDVIGISLRNIDSTNKRKVVFYYKYLSETIDIIKSCSNAKIVLGGSGFSIFANEIMFDEPRIDFGIFLEGEIAFSELLKNIETPENVHSLYYRKNGKVIFTGTGSLPGAMQFNMISSNGMPFERYKKYRDAIGIETKRGCSLSCIYCIYPFLNGRSYRLKDHVLVVDEIECLINKHGIERFMFVDSVFNIPKKHAEEICREIIKRKLNVRWSAWFKEKNIDREFLVQLKEAGCDNLIFSPDGFSDDVLAKLGKNITTQDILETYQILKRENGFEVNYNFFKNPPGQNFRNLISMVLFIIQAKMKLKKRVHFEFNSLRIEPHTKLYEIALKEGIIKKSDNLLFPKYYTQRKTWFIEKLFNLMLRLKGL
jgi:anaerobic magnesium-protoporphyrin IX monomethyl ester cyclase